MHLLAFALMSLLEAQAAANEAPVPAEPDVALIINLRAREVRFLEKPEGTYIRARASINGHDGETVTKTDRFNLPEEVEPHVTYRDVGIRLTITSTLPNIEQILDEALASEEEDP
jgi:hypothetical protein